MISILIGTLAVGFALAFVIAFWEEIIDWATQALKELLEIATMSWAYVQRLPLKIAKIVRWIENNVIKERTIISDETHELTDEEIDQMVPDPLTREQAEQLKSGRQVTVGVGKS